MTISQRKRKYTEITETNIETIHYKLSLPEIVYKNKFKTDDFYYYVFCEPEDCTFNVNDTKKAKIVEIDECDSVKDDRNENNKMMIDDEAKMIDNNNKVNDNYNDLITDDESDDTKMSTDANVNKINDDELYELIDSDSSIKSNDTESVDGYTEPTNDKFETNDNHNKVDSAMDTNTGEEATVDNTNYFQKAFKIKSYEIEDKTEFKFSNPVVLDINDNGIEIGCDPGSSNIHSTEEIALNDSILKVKNNLSWIFTQTSEYKTLKYADIRDPTKDVSTKKCKVCWIFKPNKCENCKKLKDGPTIDTATKDKQEDDIVTKKNVTNTVDNNNIMSSIDKNNVLEEKVEKRPNLHKIDMWRCEVCLINNTKDRSTCVCCESKRFNENGNTKILFGYNKTFLPIKVEKKETEKPELKPILEAEKPSVVQTENVVIQKNIPLQMIETKNVFTTQNMDIEIETDRQVSNTINEYMEVEEPSTPFISPFNPTPMNMLAANVCSPFVGTNIQFNIGSTPTQYAKTGRKIKKAARTIPKAFHK